MVLALWSQRNTTFGYKTFHIWFINAVKDSCGFLWLFHWVYWKGWVLRGENDLLYLGKSYSNKMQWKKMWVWLKLCITLCTSLMSEHQLVPKACRWFVYDSTSNASLQFYEQKTVDISVLISYTGSCVARHVSRSMGVIYTRSPLLGFTLFSTTHFAFPLFSFRMH